MDRGRISSACIPFTRESWLRDKYPGITINNETRSRRPYITLIHIVHDVRETNLIRRDGEAPPFVSARVNIVQERAAAAYGTAGIQVSRFPNFADG